MSMPNLPTCFCSSNEAPEKSKLFTSVFRPIPNPTQIQERRQVWPRFHLKSRLRSYLPSSFTPSLHLRMPPSSEHFDWGQRAYCLLLSCLLLSRLELTGCEPQQGSDSDSSKYLHGEEGHHHFSKPAETALPLHEEHLPLHLPPPIFNNSQTNSHLISEENPASVIASSFRTFDQQQHDPSNSKEDSSSSGGRTTHSGGQNPKKKTRNCDTTVLKRCLDGLPPMNASGIPATAQAVKTACRIYDVGIHCYDTWARQCLPEKHREKVKESITGAHEMYTFLCKDTKFRNDYLKHTVCYKKLSPHWDDCSRQFIEGLKRNTKHNYTAFCCIRLEFLTCVNKYSSYSCNREASKFLMKMAETLVRSTIRTKSDDYCAYVHPEDCVPIVEPSGAATKSQNGMLLLIWSVSLIFSSTFPSSSGTRRRGK